MSGWDAAVLCATHLRITIASQHGLPPQLGTRGLLATAVRSAERTTGGASHSPPIGQQARRRTLQAARPIWNSGGKALPRVSSGLGYPHEAFGILGVLLPHRDIALDSELGVVASAMCVELSADWVGGVRLPGDP
jgi:hypothetical protein